MARRAFSLVEILIGVFVLALALVAVATVFLVETNRIKTNTEEVLGRSARQSGEVLFENLDRNEYPFTEGWTIESIFSTDNGIRVMVATYLLPNLQTNSVAFSVMSPRGLEPEFLVMLHQNYVPVNGDKVISWYGFVHEVHDDSLTIQEFEKEKPIVVIPLRSTNVLDYHRIGRIPVQQRIN